MIFRDILPVLEQAARQYKAVALTGPRQSGKTTLAREAFPHLPYVSMENPDTRELARADPRGLLRRYAGGCILDEVQRAPFLFSYLQEILVSSDWFQGLRRWCELAGESAGDARLVYGGEADWTQGETEVVPWSELDGLAAEL